MSMRTSSLLHAITGGLLLAGAVAAHASNYGFLSDTPMSSMHRRDIDSLLKAANTALDTKRDGETAVWTNEGTGNSVKLDATMTISQTTKDGERTCRRMTATLNAKGQSMTLRPQYCKTGNGAWQFQKPK
ncbi:MAG TPA: RT0821/Lpp0805 family surface protein [Trinickia sp.]|nr:RT0821/Lpp0805 family surface protein [Trinickia sp.]